MTREVELWLYGSRARGDADAMSDTDVLAVATNDAHLELALAEVRLPRINVSYYTWEEIECMRSYGSLYLHHIAAEGVRLKPSETEPGRMSRLLANLPPFSRAREDLAGFQRALVEGLASLEDGGWPDFECEVIATVARHAAILGAYCIGSPAFGRERPFHVVGQALSYDEAHISALLKPATGWRLHQDGPHRTGDATATWLMLVGGFLQDLQEVIDDYTEVLSRAA